MRKILSLALLAAVCGFAGVRADVTVIERVDDMGTTIDRTEMFKGGHTRVDYSPGLSTIRDRKSGEVIRLMRAQKSYARIPTGVTAAVDGRRVSWVVPKGVALTPTGKKDTISGYAAEEYTCSAANVRMSVWLTKATPDYANILKQMSVPFGRGVMGGMLTGIGLDLAALPGFPVRLVSELPSGQTSTTTVLAVSTTPIADSEFEIPDDYQESIPPVTSPPALAPTPLTLGVGKPASQ